MVHSLSQLGVNIAIIRNGRILLTKREDFEVWCLPGGAVDQGESVAQAAIREAREETGLEVELTRLVGVYSRPRWHYEGNHAIVVAARPVGGSLCLQAGEVLEASYFSREELPEVILFGQRRRILDALDGLSGVVRSDFKEWPFKKDMSRDELYALRDNSRLSRQQFYLQYFPQTMPGEENLDVVSHAVED